jgi:hypothetical protein
LIEWCKDPCPFPIRCSNNFGDYWCNHFQIVHLMSLILYLCCSIANYSLQFGKN